MAENYIQMKGNKMTQTEENKMEKLTKVILTERVLMQIEEIDRIFIGKTLALSPVDIEHIVYSAIEESLQNARKMEDKR